MKEFKVLVKFDLNNKKVIDCIMQNFDYNKMDNNGYIEYGHRGNKKTTEKTALNRVKMLLNTYNTLRNSFTIVKVVECK